MPVGALFAEKLAPAFSASEQRVGEITVRSALPPEFCTLFVESCCFSVEAGGFRSHNFAYSRRVRSVPPSAALSIFARDRRVCLHKFMVWLGLVWFSISIVPSPGLLIWNQYPGVRIS